MSSSGSTIEITERSVNDLRPPERSVRTHNRAQERKLTRIIRKHGIVAPIIVDPNGYIINGVLVWKCFRRECLDHVVIFGERHLRHVLLLYTRYCNRAEHTFL